MSIIARVVGFYSAKITSVNPPVSPSIRLLTFTDTFVCFFLSSPGPRSVVVERFASLAVGARRVVPTIARQSPGSSATGRRWTAAAASSSWYASRRVPVTLAATAHGEVSQCIVAQVDPVNGTVTWRRLENTFQKHNSSDAMRFDCEADFNDSLKHYQRLQGCIAHLTQTCAECRFHYKASSLRR